VQLTGSNVTLERQHATPIGVTLTQLVPHSVLASTPPKTASQERPRGVNVIQYGARSIGTWSVRTHCIQPITTHTEISKRSDWLMSTDPVPILMAPYCNLDQLSLWDGVIPIG
jgi:hypothetical protein